MAKLTAAARKRIPTSSFAGPDRSYPVNDKNHARNALSRVAQFGNSELQARVRAAVHRKFPSIGKSPGGYGDNGYAYSEGGYKPNPNVMKDPVQGAVKKLHPRMHALSKASATHLLGQNLMTKPHHDRIHAAADNAIANYKNLQPQMNPAQPQDMGGQPGGQPFGSFAPPMMENG